MAACHKMAGQSESAESLLRRLIELDDPRYVPAAFILAVMLERKRLLKIKEEVQREGHRVFIYEQPHTADLFTIPDPNLQLNHLDQVQREVAALLEHGLNPPPNQPPAAASVGGDSANVSAEAAPLGPVVESGAKPT